MDIKDLDSKIIYDASIVLGLSERSSIQDIKNRYRHLVKKWHPDKGSCAPEVSHKKTQEITRAYKIIMTYCENYHYSFRENDIVNNLPVSARIREKMKEQYGKDPIWSNK